MTKVKNELSYISTNNLNSISVICLDILLEERCKPFCYSANLHLAEHPL